MLKDPQNLATNTHAHTQHTATGSIVPSTGRICPWKTIVKPSSMFTTEVCATPRSALYCHPPTLTQPWNQVQHKLFNGSPNSYLSLFQPQKVSYPIRKFSGMLNTSKHRKNIFCILNSFTS